MANIPNTNIEILGPGLFKGITITSIWISKTESPENKFKDLQLVSMDLL